ncbi:MAG: UMP kinase [Promethearchaeota archaeon]|jgi:uridylate kinase
MKNIVIKIGGSLLFNNSFQINAEKITQFSTIIRNTAKYDSIVVVCGGGLIAREYIKTVRLFKRNEAFCDTIGIDLSQINSRLIIASLGESAYPIVPKNVEDLSKAILFNKIVVMGGLQPGQSTTSVAFEVAELIDAESLVILTDVEGIYDKDPKEYTDAKLLKSLDYNQLQKIILKQSGNKQAAAGEYRIFDLVSLQILKRSRITVYIISGKDLNEFRKFWNGNTKIKGTIITN